MGAEPGTDYWARLQMDPDLARRRRNLPPMRNPPLQGWTRDLARMTDVVDVIIRSNLKDPGAFQGLPRPLTGIDFLERSERAERISRVTAKANPIALPILDAEV